MKALPGGLVAIGALVLVSLAAVAPATPTGPVRITEVAWSGAEWDPAAEWIELFNATSEPIDLAGWRLVSSDGSPSVELQGTIAPRAAGEPSGGYYLLERAGDGAVPGIAADWIYRGALTDRGETLYLYDPDGGLSDSANGPNETGTSWPAGTDGGGVPPYASMERIDHRLPDGRANWASSTAELRLGPSDRTVRGTPRSENSVFNVPPTPAFDIEPRYPLPGAAVAFDASDSSDENDAIASYRWDFGDGHGGSGPIAAHTYVLPGDYLVTLTVIDGKGGASQASRTVRVRTTSPLVADFSVVALDPDAGLLSGSRIRFQDESSDVDGEIVAREWDLGDGSTAVGEATEHSYGLPGDYLVLLRVVDDRGEEAVQTQSVTISSRRPIAAFTHSPDRPNEEEPVRLDASDSYDPDGDIVAYRWDFDGDGATDRELLGPTVEHAFSVAGDRVVSLTVVDDYAEVSGAYAVTIRVNATPIAEFRLSEFAVEELAPIRFTDLSYDEDSTIACRLWEFGDGATASEPEPEHAYDHAGTYTVSLTVTDGDGARCTATAEVTIANLPPSARLSVDEAERPTGALFEFDASASIDPSPGGSIAQYEWDLDGDGTYERATTSPTLCYAYGDDGTIAVGLRVTDDDGACAVADRLRVRIVNRAPRVGRITWTPTAPTDADDVLLSVDGSDPDGEIVQWFWDLGDGITVIASGPTVRFPADGRHTVAVTAQDDDGARSDPFVVEVHVANAPPVAAFTVAMGDARCIAFDARASHDLSPSGEIGHVAWDFGDGTSCPGAPDGCGGAGRWTPVHCYAAPGTYDVTLVVVDNRGALARAERTIRIAE